MFKSKIFKKKTVGLIIGAFVIVTAAISNNSNSYANNNFSVTASNESIQYNGVSYKIIQVDGGDLSGGRQANVAVDIGYGDRTY